MVKRPTTLKAGVAAVMAVMLTAGPAHAQQAVGWATFPDQIIQQYTTTATGWVPKFQQLALGTFGLLSVLHIAWAGIKLAFRGAVLEEFIAEMVNAIMFLGFGLFVLGNGPTLLQDIVNSFRVAGKDVGGVGLAPSQILTAGLTIIGKVWAQLSLWHPGAAAGLIIVALVVLLCLAWICAWMVIALVQVAVYLPIAVFFMGFLGSVWTRDMAIATVRQAFALGAKLMMLELLAAFAVQTVQNMLGVLDDFTSFNAGVVIGATFILALMVKVLPDWLAGIIGGSSIAEGGAIVAAGAAAAGGLAGAALTTAGVGSMAVNAGRLAGAQMAARQDAGTAPATALGRGASMLGRGIAHMATAPVSDASRRLTGQFGANHGVSTWRMGADLGNRARLIRGDLDGKPQPGTGGGPPGAGGLGARGAVEPWMAMSGGFAALSPEHQSSAQRSYAAWAEANPELGRRHGLGDYVSYVQAREAERRQPAAGSA